MTPGKNAAREAREARERLRIYNARHSVHAHTVRRRRRDNVWSVIGIVIVAALATVAQITYFTAGPGAATTATTTPTPGANPTPESTPKAERNVGEVPPPSIAEGRTWSGELDLNDVKLGISLDGAAAPQATSVFISLARKGYYTQTGDVCHRITTSETAKLIQCGSPTGDGTGNAGFSFGPLENVPALGVYPAGTIAMARGADQYSQGSQFFITFADSTLDASTGGYTVIGKVTSGLDSFVSEIGAAGVKPGSGDPSDGQPAVPTKITRLELH